MVRRVRTERVVTPINEFAAGIVKLTPTAESINMLVYGDSNAGKTRLAGTAEGRTLWLVCEPGYKTAARAGAIGYVRPVTDSSTALAAVDWLYEKQHYRRFDWLIIDGISTIQDRIRLGYAQEAFDASANSPKRARAHRNLPDKPDYFNTQNFLKTWLAMLIDLPVNLLVSAHVSRMERETDGVLLGFAALQGKGNEVSNSISGLMDVTAYLEAKSLNGRIRRRLWFESPPGDMHYVVGDKFDALGRYMNSPTIPAILEKIGAGSA